MNNVPSLILLIGPSAGGKSFFCRHWLKNFPYYEFADDLPIVLNYLRQNNLPKIEDPAAWDEIIVLLAKTLSSGKKYIVEFARGHDPNYLKLFDIKAEDIYPRALKLFLDSVDPSLVDNVAIIHVTSGFERRLERNHHRRTVTDHDLSDSVLERVFRQDVFKPEYDSDDSSSNPRFGKIIVDGRIIPVSTINNDNIIPPEDSTSHFNGLVARTMEYFNDIL